MQCFKDARTEYERWDCFGKHVYRSTDDPSNAGFMEHDCGGVGWGNSIRAFYNVFGMAALLNRRVLVRFDTMFKLWEPPYGLPEWNNGIANSNHLESSSVFKTAHKIWDYEKYGREDQVSRFDNWLGLLSRGDEESWYDKVHVIGTGVCAGVQSMIVKGDCASSVLTNYGKCASDQNWNNRLSEEQLLVPFFTMTFSKPSQLMVTSLAEIRRRLSLPQLPAGFEPNPGAFGLYTPGYYMLAFHFRRVPLGFEPLSKELNSDSNLPRKVEMLSAYWYHAKKFAKQAAKIARCRNETLIIYFATDDIHNLRPEAKKKLSGYGKVVFGLLESEVGHVSPMWRSVDNDEILQRANELKSRGIKRSDLIGTTNY